VLQWASMKQEKWRRELLNKVTRKRLMGFVEQKVRAEEDVEEIVQETLLTAWDCLPMFKGRSKLFSWVCGIARHEIGDFYRKKKIKEVVFSRLPFLKEIVSKALGPELAYQELEMKRKILKTFKSLSEGYWQVLRLKYVEEMSVKEIAFQLCISAKAVESRLSRAREAFKKEYAVSPVKIYSQKDW
jgi:RNA polymerase sigma-70 factor, ECF subfamily